MKINVLKRKFNACIVCKWLIIVINVKKYQNNAFTVMLESLLIHMMNMFICVVIKQTTVKFVKNWCLIKICKVIQVFVQYSKKNYKI